MLARDVRFPIPAQYTHVTTPGRDHYRSFAGNGDIHICRDPMIARALRIGVQAHSTITDVDLRLGAGIPFVGVFLLVSADAFVDYYPNLIFVGGSHIDRPAVIDDV